MTDLELAGGSPALVPGSQLATVPYELPAAQAVEERTADPAGSDIYGGRVWDLGGLFKFFTGIATKLVLLVDSLAGESGDALIAGPGPSFAPVFAAQYADILIVFDGSGALIAVGPKMDITIDFACAVIGWTMFAEAAVTARIDLWKTTYAGAPPTVANTMPGANANKPQLAAAQKATGGVPGWTVAAIDAGEVIRVNLDTNNTGQRMSLSLKVRRT